MSIFPELPPPGESIGIPPPRNTPYLPEYAGNNPRGFVGKNSQCFFPKLIRSSFLLP